MFDNIFQGKRVLVTGHTGFKGSWLALWLKSLGAEVTGLALPPNTQPSHFSLIRLHELISHREADIRNFTSVQDILAAASPEIVFHLAAQPLVRESYEDPKWTFDTNIGGTVNLLEAIRLSSSVRAVVVVTSDKCYENREWVWGYRENDPMGGHDPYSASKGATEIVAAAYLRSFFGKGGRGPSVGLATARAGNVIGGGDWAKDRLIPDCVRALCQGKPIVLRNPQSTRPWQHVLEPLSGYLTLAAGLFKESERFSGSWNFGPVEAEHVTVGELAERFVTAWGSGRIEVAAQTSGAHEAHLLRLTIDKAAFEMHWMPVLTGSVAIDWTASWYNAWYSGGLDLRELSLSQIQTYQKLGLQLIVCR
jgi:CDP-glucose 4,6-dehydratase